MALTPGSRLGPYEVTALLGEGGMGAVYRARDTKLNREVALKVLLPDVANDPERLARFRREAQVLASLNHPHIGAIHGLEESNGTIALVMELVEGEDLSQRIARGAIPLDEALPIARQIAEALEAAHEQGIVHRDLKPANIKVRPDGTVKVLDFGLAKALEPASGLGLPASGRAADSPTITTPAMTQAGMILGTAAYMAPEQAKGRPVDKRADIWAFGGVLYEMLTGQRTFPGDNLTEVLAAVVRGEPEWSALPRDLPPAILTLLRRCLEKDRGRRVADASTLRFVIDEASSLTAAAGAGPPATVASPRARLVRTAPWLLVSVLAASAAWALLSGRTVSAPTPLLQVTVPPPEGARLTQAAGLSVSPSGTRLVFAAAGSDGRTRLWQRRLDESAAHEIRGSINGSAPFWSPDGANLGFGADGKLMVTDVATGRARVVADAPSLRGASWSRDHRIIFAPSENSGLSVVPAGGGTASVVTTLDSSRGEGSHRYPQFLPDDRHFLFRVQAADNEVAGLYIGSLEGGTPRRLVGAESQGVYVEPGMLLYVVDGTLFAHPFDWQTATLSGAPRPLVQGVNLSPVTSFASFSVSASGTLAYRPGASEALRTRLQWLDRSGAVVETPALPPGAYTGLDLSRDGKLAVQRSSAQGAVDIWVVEGAGAPRRVTFNAYPDESPTWSPDGRQLLFFSGRPSGDGTLFVKDASGTGEERLVLPSKDRAYPGGWSPDGRLVVFALRQPDTGWDLHTIEPGGPQPAAAFARSAFNEQHGTFSPDGRWIAYTSDESGANEVYVQAFPGGSEKVLVSTAGGALPVWRRDGRELFFASPDRMLMAVDVTAAPPLRVSSPRALFPLRIPYQSGAGLVNPSGQRPPYAPSPDGQRFLVITEDGTTPQRIDLVLNWPALLTDRQQN